MKQEYILAVEDMSGGITILQFITTLVCYSACGMGKAQAGTLKYTAIEVEAEPSSRYLRIGLCDITNDSEVADDEN